MADTFDIPQLPDILAFDVDSFVDENLPNTCPLFDEDNCLSSVVQVQKPQEKSPFHESDSGVSEVSDVAGLSPSHNMDIMLDEMLDNMVATPFLVENTADNDFTTSCNGVLSNIFNDSDSPVESANSAPRTQSVRVTRSKSAAGRSVAWPNGAPPVVGIPLGNAPSGGSARNTPVSDRFDMGAVSSSPSHSDADNESDIVDSRRSRCFSKRKPKGSVRVSQAGTALPTKSSDTSVGNCSVTSVKVLRIVNSNGGGVSNEDDLTKALEERNRKNAEMARQNRLKKKAYVGNLEEEVEVGRKRISELETTLNDVEGERDSYKREVEYLKSVLANQSALAGLLKNIPSVNGVSLSSSISRKRVAELDHSYVPSKKRHLEGPSASTAGVCLHVDSDNVSLEFCHHCAKMAKGMPLS